MFLTGKRAITIPTYYVPTCICPLKNTATLENRAVPDRLCYELVIARFPVRNTHPVAPDPSPNPASTNSRHTFQRRPSSTSLASGTSSDKVKPYHWSRALVTELCFNYYYRDLSDPCDSNDAIVSTYMAESFLRYRPRIVTSSAWWLRFNCKLFSLGLAASSKWRLAHDSNATSFKAERLSRYRSRIVTRSAKFPRPFRELFSFGSAANSKWRLASLRH